MFVLLTNASRMLSSSDNTSFPLTTRSCKPSGGSSGTAGLCRPLIPSTLSSVVEFCARKAPPHKEKNSIAPTNERTTLIDHPHQDFLIVNLDYSYRMAS